jgi:aminoglycoside/choline kinase family phosphotransferase/dTDP-glucose pyrophosphorylase
MKALVLAAGLGTRLLPYTHHTPKPLFTLAGVPLLARHVMQLEAAGCEAAVVNTHHLHAQIDSFVRRAGFRIPVHTRYEPELLGTGGAIGNLRDVWDERPFLVVNADIRHGLDLAEVAAAHRRSGAAATLVLVDDPEFNTVETGPDGRIRRFAPTRAETPPGALTFTGIQCLSPVVLDYLPHGGPGDSIAAFRAMIADGLPVHALTLAGPWVDLGTPERYRRAAREACAAAAWESAFGRPAPEALDWEPLDGDGSDREWFRVCGRGDSLVVADHGIRTEAHGITEADAFDRIGRHLKACGAAVPSVHIADRFAGIVVVEDLGTVSLQRAVHAERDRGRVLALYRSVIDALIQMAVTGAHGFDPAWAWQTPYFDRQVVLERECRYFQAQFLEGGGRLQPGEDLAPEFEALADAVARTAVSGFLHRDVQSRNIMLAGGRPHFIDFQGGRIGPVQYDLASLLIDPYVDLPPEEQRQLFAYAAQQFARHLPMDPAQFRRGYDLCALSRNLQALGAFAFLSRVKGKRQFEQYIPAALNGLARRLEAMRAEFPKLRAAVEEARERYKLRITNDELNSR